MTTTNNEIDILNKNSANNYEYYTQYGADILNDFKKCNEEYSSIISSHDTGTEVLERFASIMSKIDMEELTFEKNKNKKKQGFLDKFLKLLKDEGSSIIDKYKNIEDDLNDIEIDLVRIKRMYKENNEALKINQENMIRIKDNSVEALAKGQEDLEMMNNFDTDNQVQQALKNVFIERLGALSKVQSKCTVQIQGNQLRIKNNFDIYTSVETACSTTMPMIHAEINNLKMIKDYSETRELLVYMHDANEKLTQTAIDRTLKLTEDIDGMKLIELEDYKVNQLQIEQLVGGLQKSIDNKKIQQQVAIETLDSENTLRLEAKSTVSAMEEK